VAMSRAGIKTHTSHVYAGCQMMFPESIQPGRRRTPGFKPGSCSKILRENFDLLGRLDGSPHRQRDP